MKNQQKNLEDDRMITRKDTKEGIIKSLKDDINKCIEGGGGSLADGAGNTITIMRALLYIIERW